MSNASSSMRTRKIRVKTNSLFSGVCGQTVDKLFPFTMISTAYKTQRNEPSDIKSGRQDSPGLEKRAFFVTLSRYAKLGAASALFLNVIELIDLHYQLTPVLSGPSERLVFTAYFSLNVASGFIIGTVVGLGAQITHFLYKLFLRLLARVDRERPAHKILAGVAVSALAAALLNQILPVYRYILGLMVEAQKLPYMYGHLFENRKIVSYALVFGLFIACSTLAIISRHMSRVSRPMRLLFCMFLLLLIGAAYYVDSRIEVELYGYSLHRTMFLLSIALVMSFLATIYLSSPRIQAFVTLGSTRKKMVAAAATLVLICLTGFTFYYFGQNQNLKTQVFTRTTQAKQHFMLAQSLLDFDRDGYSRYLDGGDADDRNASINPAQVEVIEDNTDNNCIGGDLTQQQIDEWRAERSRLNIAARRDGKPFNIIYFFIDALRADHLSVYGYNRQTTPNIDKLAARSSVFENAYSPSANTFESAPKFMQSSYWDAHQETWTEVLARSGYNSYLFPSHRLPMLRRYVKGVQVVDEARGKRLEQTVDLVISSLSNTSADRPFLAYVYCPDPHSPYKKHAAFNYGSSDFDLYDGEIAHTDHQIGRIFEWMEKSGRLEDTMVVIMSDHGESLGERMVYKHSSQLYNEQTHIPMIVYAPGVPARRIADYVSTVDLGPTILGASGIEIPKEYLGVNLIPLMRGEPFVHPPIYAEESYRLSETQNIPPEEEPQTVISKYMVIDQSGFKLIYNRSFYFFELFDLRRDRLEHNNLYDQVPEKALELKRMLGRFVDIVTKSRPPDADESRYTSGKDENREPWIEVEP